MGCDHVVLLAADGDGGNGAWTLIAACDKYGAMFAAAGFNDDSRACVFQQLRHLLTAILSRIGRAPFARPTLVA